jgi:hypothetical protein
MPPPDSLLHELMIVNVHFVNRSFGERPEGLGSRRDRRELLLVPDAGFEPATFGLQNRCSTS